MELHVELKLTNNGSGYLIARCPDEDSEMSITIGDDLGSMVHTLTLDEAEEIAEYLKAHVENERISNPEHKL